MQFPILLLLLLLMALTLIGIIPAIAVQIIPVGSPPRPSTTLVLQVTVFRTEETTEYGQRPSALRHLLVMHTTVQIRASILVPQERVLKNFPVASVSAGILLPVTWTTTTVLWMVSSPTVTIGPVHLVSAAPVPCTSATVASSTPRAASTVHTAFQSAARESPIDGQDALSPGTGR